jgi:hypothetical protein
MVVPIPVNVNYGRVLVPVALARQLWYLTARAPADPLAGGTEATIIEISCIEIWH